jgi:very-short-patch-repair endonuclease
MKFKILNYKPELKELARKLRKNSTLSEKLLWNYLKGKKINGFDFDRQKPIDNYIVDFYCKELMLAIEIDGITHNEKMKQDSIRQEKMERLGINFLRFADEEVRKNPEGVAQYIKEWIKSKY